MYQYILTWFLATLWNFYYSLLKLPKNQVRLSDILVCLYFECINKLFILCKKKKGCKFSDKSICFKPGTPCKDISAINVTDCLQWG